MKDFTQWTLWRVISLIPIKKKKKHVNEEGQDQQPEATMNASCKLFHWSHTALLYVAVCSSSLYKQIKQLLDHMYSWQVPPPLRRTRRWVSCEEPGGQPLYPLSSLAACSSALSEAAEPSNRWEAMAAWCDMLFLTTSPFLHSVISYMGTKCVEVFRQFCFISVQRVNDIEGNVSNLHLFIRHHSHRKLGE